MKAFFLMPLVLSFAYVFGQNKIAEYFCPICGCKNDGKTFDQRGTCPLCDMKLQQVGTFNFEMIFVSPDEELMPFKTSRPDGVGRIFLKTQQVKK
jgi:hypothetical protein